MANKEQLNLLLKSVRTWNLWRIEHFDVEPDLRGANLVGANLSDANLSNANLPSANLPSANLVGANLRGANLSNAHLYSANLRSANLEGANLEGAKLVDADLSDANLEGAKLVSAFLRGADLEGANLPSANLEGANLEDAKLRGANLVGANLVGAKLRGANLVGAKLRSADLSDANLVGANLVGAKLRGANLVGANLVGANLSNADLEGANFVGANLSNANLHGANLVGANLSNANLSDANLCGANLVGANLSDANLCDTRLITATALHTNFGNATLTGACIQDWHINADTTLDGVICDFIYLKDNQQERRPSAPHQTFAPGEFTKLFQKAQETLDLIFRHGVDWQAVAYAFQQLQIENEADDLAIASIENKGDGVVVIRIKAAPTADRPKLHGSFMDVYEVVHKTLESQYQARLEDKNKHINQLFALVQDYQAQDTEVKKLMADAPKFNFNAPVGSVADTIQAGGRQQAIQHNYASEPQQTLAAAAKEIQALLQQLEQANPTATEADQKAFVNAALPTTTRDRILGAAQGGGLAWLEGTPYGKITKAIIEGWQKPSK
ncbi:pentapeptide repeat-containing protein [Leptolyngbya sp. FACHB-321]|uniref:pentapeptide repeat-containing protein n=1 Tax=Leptolyngbya sp. FACHB-321 TaxID=2692807 RepID=UPI001688E9BF|nr:pentapeptide repeat-containing protein [Leptolyngbya sp. FACHB-321]MBD2033876.1 pentapeptide repeat-containing protein [Leptolyngbya sp. FACHB-321]